MVILQRQYAADEYIRRWEAGEFGDVRTELINGEVREKMPEGWWHNEVVRLLTNALEAAMGSNHMVVGSSVRFGNDVPQPDVSILSRPRSAYRKRGRIIDSTELIHVCEVSDTTGHDDMGERMRRYAQAGIPQYWIANIDDESAPRLEVYSNPANSTYMLKTIYLPGDDVPLPPTLGCIGSIHVSDFLA